MEVSSTLGNTTELKLLSTAAGALRVSWGLGVQRWEAADAGLQHLLLTLLGGRGLVTSPFGLRGGLLPLSAGHCKSGSIRGGVHRSNCCKGLERGKTLIVHGVEYPTCEGLSLQRAGSE